jgi:hypothetical protein
VDRVSRQLFLSYFQFFPPSVLAALPYIDCYLSGPLGTGVNQSLICITHISDVLFATEEMNWVAPELRQAVKDVPRDLSLDIRIHITRSDDLIPALTINASSRNSSDAVAEETEEKAEAFDPTTTEKVVPASPTEGEGLKFCLGRPDLATLIKEEVECAIGPVSVNGAFLFLFNLTPILTVVAVAGPLHFTNVARHILRGDFAGPQAALCGVQPVSLHVENFGSV